MVKGFFLSTYLISQADTQHPLLAFEVAEDMLYWTVYDCCWLRDHRGGDRGDHVTRPGAEAGD